MRSVLPLALAAFIVSPPALADSGTWHPNLWGTSGLVGMPTSGTLNHHEFSATARYLLRNQALIGSLHMGLLDNLELGLVYGTPGANGLGGNLKWRILDQKDWIPLSLAIGGSLGGIRGGSGLFTGNQAYMVVSHTLKWPWEDGSHLILGEGSFGFSGNLEGAQLMAGVNVPILTVAGIQVEYLGRRGASNDQLNIGLHVTPFPFLDVAVFTTGSLSLDVNQRDLGFGLSYTGPMPMPPGMAVLPSPDLPPETPQATPIPQVSPPPEMAMTAPLSGKVTDGQKPIPGAVVTLTQGTTAYGTETGPDGAYQFLDIPVGSYTLKVTKRGWQTVETEVTVPTSMEHHQDITLKAAPGQVQGKVTNDKGQALAGVSVGIDKLGLMTLTKSDGSYTLPEVPAGAHLVTFTLKGQVVDKINVTLAAGDSFDHNVTVRQGPQKALVRGVVVDAKKAPVAKARVMIEGNGLTVMTLTGASGDYQLKELPSGSYKLTVTKTGMPTKTLAITLKEGDTINQDITMTP